MNTLFPNELFSSKYTDISMVPNKFGRLSPSSHHDTRSSYYHDDVFGDTDTEDTPSEKMFNEKRFKEKSFDHSSKGFQHFETSRFPEANLPSQDSHLHTSHAPQAFKCRQLPCRTFVSTGCCPYGDRCVFLHDPSIASKAVCFRSKKKSKDDTTSDAFFWPTMSLNSVMGKTDAKNMPHTVQSYAVPPPNNHVNGNNDTAVYSMWEHFLDFCKSDPLSVVQQQRKVPLVNPYASVNPYTGKRRLPIFMRLSQNQDSPRFSY